MLENVSFIVPSDSWHENTFAVVKAEVSKHELCSVSAFKRALKKALTAWVKNTTEGYEIYWDNAGFFNVMDFASLDRQSDEMKEYLRKEGIEEVTVTVYQSDENNRCWELFDSLADHGELN